MPLRVLAGAEAQCWIAEAPVRRRRLHGIECIDNGALLLAWMHLDAPPDGDWRRLSADAYRRLSAFQSASGYPGLLRVWNFLAGITAGEGDAERYRQFVLGRHEGWSGRAGDESRLPAATAVGMRGGGLHLVWLAAARAGQQVENPRQTSAFRYPRDYGPKSPSFSRAVLHRIGAATRLYVSGTASIVGHRSLHAGDPDAQLAEILRNLGAVVAEAERRADRALRPLAVTVYLRREADLPRVRAGMARHFGDTLPLTILAADICRRELLVEIEAIYG